MISGEPIPVDKSRMMQLLLEQLTAISLYNGSRENRFRNLTIPNCANGQ
jgi:hypothetical protein